MARLEQHGAGSIDMLQTLLTFYYGRGYNPSWVVLADNAGVAKRLLATGEKRVSLKEATEGLQTVRASLAQRLDELIGELLVS